MYILWFRGHGDVVIELVFTSMEDAERAMYAMQLSTDHIESEIHYEPNV